MRPYERWADLWQFFMALDQDWDLDFVDEDAAIVDEIAASPKGLLQTALVQWHDAFDSATDEELAQIVGDFNPSYDPERRFGGYAAWASWVREHLEAELARRGVAS